MKIFYNLGAYANSADLDHSPQNLASDWGLHHLKECLCENIHLKPLQLENNCWYFNIYEQEK